MIIFSGEAGEITLPANIRAFAILAYLSLAVGMIWLISRYPQIAAATKNDAFVIGITYIFFGTISLVAALLTWQAAWKQKNWARWLCLFMTAAAVAASIAGGFTSQPCYAYEYEVELCCTTLGVIATWYAFTGNARPWFRKESV